MQKVTLPQKITCSEGNWEGQITIEPCYPGYGTTIGNSLRRVLLSSLGGAAVVGVKIKGASHEFTTLPKVKEDILEIILNLKNLRLKFFGNEGETVKLDLNAKGQKKVTARDIEKNSLIEIMNPELPIAEITDADGSLEMEIFVSYGYGYSPIDGRKTPGKEVGYIEVDSIFCPVRAVKVAVENIRVGQMTDWDKLILDIKTDGTLSFKEAFQQAAAILVEQFSFVLGEANKAAGIKADADASAESAAEEQNENASNTAEEKEAKKKAKKSSKKKENKEE